MKFTENKQYELWKYPLKAVRDSVKGEAVIKYESTVYLKHPDMLDQTSPQALRRYSAYLHGAEFDEFPGSTGRTMIGRMTSGEHEIELPSGIEYMKNDADGDGLSLSSVAELLYRNLLEAKFHIILAEMDSLASVDIESMTMADMKRMNPRASLKLYTRESLIDWKFERINGTMQLTKALLRESYEDYDDNGVRRDFKTFLEVGLDSDGYYQLKYKEGDSGAGYEPEGEKDYPEVGGERLKWVPMQIVCDESFPAGKIPEGLGFLGPISACAIDRYQMTADYKECLRFMQPTTFPKGWKIGDKEIFEDLNGRDYIAFGVGMANNLPDGVTVDVVGLGVQAEPYERYFERNEKKARSLGAVFPSDVENKSAKEASIDDANATAAMVSIIENTEQALRRACSYCAMFMGLWSPEDVENNLEEIQINLFNDFGKQKLTPEEQQSIRDNYAASLISKDEAIRMLVSGGVTVSDIEIINGELENQGQDLPVTPRTIAGQDNNLQSE